MNKSRLALGVGIAILVGFWMLRDRGEPPIPQAPPQRPLDQTQSPTQERARAPQWLPPSPVTQAPPYTFVPGYPDYSGHSPQTPMGLYPPEEIFRFRPLGERERRRIEEQARSPYGPYYPSPSEAWGPQRQPGTGSPRAYGVDPATQDPWLRDGGGRGWGTEGYGFRRVDPPGTAGDRWRSPYAMPTQPGEWLPPDPGLFQEPNQWGAIPPERTPPSYRMYPSLDKHRDRRLSSR